MMKRVVLNCAVMYTAARIRNNFITLSLFSTLLFSMDHTLTMWKRKSSIAFLIYMVFHKERGIVS